MKKYNRQHGSAEEMLSAFQNRIDELGFGSSIESATNKVTSANEIDDADYLDELCVGVTAILDGNGYDVVAELEGDYIVIQSLYDPAASRYLQPIDEIEPNWEDIEDDIEQLADAYMQEFPNPDYE